ncbi:MAG: DNA methylase [Oscillospiraceae bacterium]|nr:DNA methylase [Oscillospiraceae bacterium]
MQHTYIAIDLKSFYASVECIARNLDPLTTNLVVADAERTEKTICLAVTPSLKAAGVSGRPRLFEVIETVSHINQYRRSKAPDNQFCGTSCDAGELEKNPALALDYIVAPPQMARYMEISTQIYHIYLRYIAPEDIHIYSVDEVMIDATGYLETYRMTAHELTMQMIRDVLKETGITATAGIGTNLYLSKIAMDILAKKMKPDSNGVRIAELDEMKYRKILWTHQPLTDFWRIGKGTAKKLAAHYIFTMGDIARQSELKEELLYKLFGVGAELLIDHAWGWEPCTMEDIKSYRPLVHSLSRGQVLSEAYSYEKGKLIIREMTELLVLELISSELLTDQIVLTVGYDHKGIPENYPGEMTKDAYGRFIPKPAHGSYHFERYTDSAKQIVTAMIQLYERIVHPNLQVRRMCIAANHVVYETDISDAACMQLTLFGEEENSEMEKKEKSLQKAIVNLQSRYGKNAVLKGMNLKEGATTIIRNSQVGGHRA